jgi:hypothetical protein
MNENLTKLQQELKAAKINEVLNRLKISGAEKFFEAYPELKAGYAVYMQRRAMRAKVGASMAPGGVFILGDAAVIAGCMAEAHTMLARLLRLPTENIKLTVERPGTRTGIRLNADVAIPEGYMTPVHSEEAPGVQRDQIGKLTEEYLSSCLAQVNPIFKRDLLVRLDAVRQTIPELTQAVIPWEQSDEQFDEE